ncbi:N-acetylmuramoyl-L-alanine amidase, partial [Candidatus Sumerlaeota bacterium]|nr:N-acetylmuramoyl-L-alanine amidase [Candidatus Sumerlaeota bacterium]
FFLSIHLNATPMKVKTPRGFEVYYLDDSSKAADRELENLENDFGIDLDGKIPGQGTVREVLGSLAEEKVRQRKQESILAALVMDQVIKRDGPFKREARGIKAANFRVLMNYNMPSILAECGFIDNPDDAALLVQEKTQDQIAALLFNAINLYFARVEPGYKASLASIP